MRMRSAGRASISRYCLITQAGRSSVERHVQVSAAQAQGHTGMRGVDGAAAVLEDAQTSGGTYGPGPQGHRMAGLVGRAIRQRPAKPRVAGLAALDASLQDVRRRPSPCFSESCSKP